VHGRKRGGREGAQHERARTRRKARGKRAAIAGDAPEGLRGERGEGRRCACEASGLPFADQRFQALNTVDTFLILHTYKTLLRSLIHNALKLRHRFCVVAYQELSSDFF